MNSRSYPTSLADVQQWRHETGTTTLEANIRFMEFVILNCIASDPITEHCMVLKGGNALRFAYESPRSTKDLDFSVDADGLPDDDRGIRDILNRTLRHAERRFGVKARCQRVNRNPPGVDATRPTYGVTICYQFANDAYFHSFEDRSNIATVIPIEISFNDLVCETSPWKGNEALRVCSLEDILAEKLRSLLQQKVRHRHRYQDVYDIAKYVRQSDIDRRKVADYLKRKSQIRDIDARKSAYDDEIRDMAAQEYDIRIHRQAPHDFIPFDEAWQDVISLVESLDIPD